ncbi:hypothetical protein F5Y05DRAFT_30147 [Hypoxylon sp. FL0543]|nr:hypothetical protein F5Y05DRAFT_30147 [Hypoxylon sp. FL0543]
MTLTPGGPNDNAATQAAVEQCRRDVIAHIDDKGDQLRNAIEGLQTKKNDDADADTMKKLAHALELCKEAKEMTTVFADEMRAELAKLDKKIADVAADAHLRLCLHMNDCNAIHQPPKMGHPAILDSPWNLNAWTEDMKGKMLVDGDHFGCEEHRFRYVYSRLHPDVQCLVLAQLHFAQATGLWDHEEIFNILQATYLTAPF